MFVCVFMLSAAASFAQDVADLARKEHERQKNIPAPARHVYTNEDMEKPQILAPDDRARLDASPEGAVTPGKVNDIPLGDVARHYRKLKKLREIEKADKSDVLPGRNPVRASPRMTQPAVILNSKPRVTQPKPTRPIDILGLTAPARENRIRLSQGDSLWKLAQRYFGNGALWVKIARVNPQLKDSNQIRAGDWIRLPEAKSSAPVRQVRVQKGDTLWKLAQANFGNGLAWSCIAEANPKLPNGDLIRAGQWLDLPARCSAVETSARLR